MYNHDAINYDRVYCAYVTATTLNQAQSSGISIIVLDFTVTLADFLLLIYNKYQIKKYKKYVFKVDLFQNFIKTLLDAPTFLIYNAHLNCVN